MRFGVPEYDRCFSSALSERLCPAILHCSYHCCLSICRGSYRIWGDLWSSVCQCAYWRIFVRLQTVRRLKAKHSEQKPSVMHVLEAAKLAPLARRTASRFPRDDFPPKTCSSSRHHLSPLHTAVQQVQAGCTSNIRAPAQRRCCRHFASYKQLQALLRPNL